MTTLGERLQAGEANDLAGPLPMEIDRFLLEADSGQEFSYRDFVSRVGDYEHEDTPDANYDAQLLVAYLNEFVSAEVMQRVRDELPADFETLFEFADRKNTASSRRA